MIKILVADDDKGITNSFVALLGMIKGTEAYGAYNSSDAVKLIEEHKPRLLILDYNLNDKLLGTEIFQVAREHNPNAFGVLITGNRDKAVEKVCEEVGIKVIIEKPIALRDFKQTLENEIIPQLNKEV